MPGWTVGVVGGIYDIHALPCDAAACVESWNKQQDALFFPARISTWDVDFLWEMNINVWAEIAIYMKNTGLLFLHK